MKKEALMVFHVETSPETKLAATNSLAAGLRDKVANQAYISTANHTFRITIIIGNYVRHGIKISKTDEVLSPENEILFPGDIRNILASLTGCPVLWIDGGEHAGSV